MFAKPLERLGKNDILIAGGKAASLSKLIKIKIPVPKGFVILTPAFGRFLKEAGLNTKIESLLRKANPKDINSINRASRKIENLIAGAELPDDIAEEIKKEFAKLKVNYVAVRSSATTEDSSTASWAGELESYLNTAKKDLMVNVKKCWTSLFAPRAIFYRFEKKLQKTKISVAVVVQKMIQSEAAGVCFTAHPVTKDKNQMVIEAGYGLGEAIVGGKITPDTYIVSKAKNLILDKNISRQKMMIVMDNNGTKEIAVPKSRQNKQKLVDKKITALARICQKIENYYNAPQDIEWALEKGRFYILQSRPITTLLDKTQKQSVYEKVFSRDYSLPMLQALYKGKACNKKPWSGKQQAFLPYIVFVREDDTVKNYYDSRGVEWIKNHIKKSIKLDKDFLNRLKNQINEKLKPIQSIYEAELPLSKGELLEFIKNFEIAYPWVEAIWWLCEMSDKEIENLDISSIEKLREKTAKLSAGTDAVVRKSLMKIFPKIKAFVHVLTIEEVKTEILPKISELKARDKVFIFTQNRLYVGGNISDIEKEYGILLERENIDENISKIKGVVACPGIVRGRIRRVMGHKQIHFFKESEVLVSPMTMPDFLPAMKKAVAFVTDEGGVTCHAAIIARELKKPCIVGTKIATQVLKDGDLVEVDATKGIVKILKRA